MQETKLKTPVEYIKEAWSIYTKKENFIFFAKIMAVVTILTFFIGFITGYLFPSTYTQNIDYSNIPLLIGFILVSLLAFIIGLCSQTTTYFSILKLGQSEKEVFKLGFRNIVKFFMVSLVVGLIVVLGLVLLIIPAVIFGVWYSFSVWLVLDKGMKIGEALKQSKAMVKGRFWKVLGRTVTFGLFAFFVSIVVVAIPYAGNLIISFVAPLFMLPFYLLYKDLSASSGL